MPVERRKVKKSLGAHRRYARRKGDVAIIGHRQRAEILAGDIKYYLKMTLDIAARLAAGFCAFLGVFWIAYSGWQEFKLQKLRDTPIAPQVISGPKEITK